MLAVEADRHLLAPLAEVADAPNIEIVHADATTPEWRTKLGPRERRWALVANLPYNVAVPLLLDLLDNEPRIETFTFIVQKEVADRLVACGGDQGLRDSHPQGGLLVRGHASSARYLPRFSTPDPGCRPRWCGLERLPAPAVDADPDRSVLS